MADLPLTQTPVGALSQSTATDTTNGNATAPRTMVVGSDGSALNKYTYSSNPYAGASVALSGPPATLTAGADTALSFGGVACRLRRGSSRRRENEMAMNIDGTSIIYDVPSIPGGTINGGYRCPICGAWSAVGGVHGCLGSTAFSTNVRQCERCGQWVFGGVYHVCPSPVCRHCYCIDVPPSGERTRPHAKCCKCQDVRLGKAIDD